MDLSKDTPSLLMSEGLSFQENGQDMDLDDVGNVDDRTLQSDLGSSHVPSDNDEDDEDVEEEDDEEDDDEEEYEDEEDDSELMGDRSRETSVMDQSVVSEEPESSLYTPTPSVSSSAAFLFPFKPVLEWIPYTEVQIDRKLPKKLKKHEYEPIPNGVLINISQPSIYVHNYTGPFQSNPSTKETSHSKKKRVWSISDGMAGPTIVTRPGLSDWLDLTGVHPLEADAFPLFCGPEASTINKQVYTTIRNSMIYAYASLPLEYMSITECYTHLRYDIQDLVVVHSFLERYRLINHESVTEITPKALASQEFGSLRKTPYDTLPKNWICSQEDSIAGVSSRQANELSVVCISCQEPISWKTHYSCRKISVFELCESCFVDGRFPTDVSSKDFVRIKGLVGKKEPKNIMTVQKMEAEWTDEELLRLLDGIEEFGDDWDRIAESVSTKSAKACLYQFLRLSTEETLYNPDLGLGSENSNYSKLWDTFAGQAPNPLMTFLYLVSCSLSPHIAAEAARAALEVAADDLEKEDIVFKGDQKKLLPSSLDLNQSTRRAAERAFDTSLMYTRSLIDLENKTIEANARILTEKQLQRVDLKLALLEDVMHQSNRMDQPPP